MATRETPDFLAGVIEGFYGEPWSPAERFELFDWMADWGLNTYLYAPKDDVKHRAIWRELYTASEAAALGEVILACSQRGHRFIYALSPGLDIRYGSQTELRHLKRRFEQMLALGGRHFALLFDDIPDRLPGGNAKGAGSFASAQCQVANALFRWTRQRSPDARFLFCPTPYCGRMAARKLGGDGYLSTLGLELLPEIDVCWTGPEIVSPEIPALHVHELRNLLRRKPVIWDNLHANDYDGRRFYCGPYAGRPLELRGEVRGLLSNPNNEFSLNYVPLRTFAEFVRCAGEERRVYAAEPAKSRHCPGAWDPRQAYLSAMREWLPRFATIGQPVALEDLILFGDCYYLPHEEGPEAEALFDRARSLLATNPSKVWRGHPARVPPGHARSLLPANPAKWEKEATAFRRQTGRLRQFCVRMTELRHRPLFYALSRRLWELREELDLLEGYVQFKSTGGRAEAACRSDFHLPGTYRGGLVARLQRLLVQQPDGAFVPAPPSVL